MEGGGGGGGAAGGGGGGRPPGPHDWTELAAAAPGRGVQVIGDALVPRRVAHAVAEGRAAAMAIAARISSASVLN
ncbi:hypothetical protein [Nocardia farcinica]|uniref:hypothetical protein n=1 Tax=Nocardia farcinica TaxID=37329 RepID=UPI00245566CE|nr:hypothetical protein [Nocardia farcinica]